MNIQSFPRLESSRTSEVMLMKTMEKQNHVGVDSKLRGDISRFCVQWPSCVGVCSLGS